MEWARVWTNTHVCELCEIVAYRKLIFLENSCYDDVEEATAKRESAHHGKWSKCVKVILITVVHIFQLFEKDSMKVIGFQEYAELGYFISTQ